jgi:hypothetical protein
MIHFEIENNLSIIEDAWDADYEKLTWGSSRENYLIEAFKNYNNFNGEFYWIVFNNNKVGHFTIYNFSNLPKGIGMFCISNTKMNFGFWVSFFRKLKNLGKFWGFCNTLYLKNLYEKLGYLTKELDDGFWLIGRYEIWNAIKDKKFKESEMF